MCVQDVIAELKEEDYDHTQLLLTLEPEVSGLHSEYSTLSDNYDKRKKNIIGT